MSLSNDCRLAARALVRDRWYAAVVIATLGLGIGLTTIAFTLVNAVVLRGLPYDDTDRLMFIESRRPGDVDDGTLASWPDCEDWRARQRSFQDLAAMQSLSVNLSDASQAPERVSGTRVTANAFGLLGQPTLRGRDFRPEDDDRGADPVAIIGYGLWLSRYGGAADIVGRVIRVNEVATRVIGVMPQDMKFPRNADMWIPLIPTEREHRRDTRVFGVFARLKPAVTLRQAQGDMQRIAAELAREHPDSNRSLTSKVMTYNDQFLGGEFKLIILMAMGAAGAVLLIACANVANLLLSRSAARAREMAVRVALGASRWRIVRPLLLESLLLGCLAGVFGLALAHAGVQAFDRSTVDVGKPYWLVFTMDRTVCAFLAVSCLVTGVLFGLAPAAQVSRTSLNQLLKEGGRSGGAGLRVRRFSTTMVTVQVALTVVLLAGAGLMVRSFLNLQSTRHAFDPDNLLVGGLRLAEQKYPGPESRTRLYESVIERGGRVAGVRAVALATVPPTAAAERLVFEREGRPAVEPDLATTAGHVQISDNYFEALGIVLRRGRAFQGRDGLPGSEAVIVNERFVAQYLGDVDPVGQRLRLRTSATGREEAWLTIVGVTPLIRQGEGLQLTEGTPIVYTPLRRAGPEGVTLIARAVTPGTPIAAGLRDAVRGIDPDLPLFNIRTFGELMVRTMWAWRLFGTMFALLAAVALLLSAVGIYAVTAHAVIQRTQEIGIRMALGAGPRAVSWMVLRGGLRQLGLGLALGLTGAVVVGRLAGALLVRVSGSDPVTLAITVVLLTLVVAAACLIPTARALRLSPVTALRAG